MKTFTLEQIAQITGGMLTKASDVAITKIAPPKLADENTLALALGEDEIANLSETKAKAALVPLGVNIDGFSTIEVERPRLAMMKLIHLFYMPPDTPNGIHSSAVVHPEAKVASTAKLGANVVVSKGAVVGEIRLGIQQFRRFKRFGCAVRVGREQGEVRVVIAHDLSAAFELIGHDRSVVRPVKRKVAE